MTDSEPLPPASPLLRGWIRGSSVYGALVTRVVQDASWPGTAISNPTDGDWWTAENAELIARSEAAPFVAEELARISSLWRPMLKDPLPGHSPGRMRTALTDIVEECKKACTRALNTERSEYTKDPEWVLVEDVQGIASYGLSTPEQRHGGWAASEDDCSVEAIEEGGSSWLRRAFEIVEYLEVRAETINGGVVPASNRDFDHDAPHFMCHGCGTTTPDADLANGSDYCIECSEAHAAEEAEQIKYERDDAAAKERHRIAWDLKHRALAMKFRDSGPLGPWTFDSSSLDEYANDLLRGENAWQNAAPGCARTLTLPDGTGHFFDAEHEDDCTAMWTRLHRDGIPSVIAPAAPPSKETP